MLARITLIVFLLTAFAASAEPFEQSLTAREGGALRIDLAFGTVEVERHAADDVHILASARGVGASSVRFLTERDGDDIVLRSEAEPWVALLRSVPSVRVRVRVPHSYPVLRADDLASRAFPDSEPGRGRSRSLP